MSVEYKGRTLTVPLSDEDRAFLEVRGKDVLIAQLDGEAKAARDRAELLAARGESVEEDAPPYDQWNVDELRAELDERRALAEAAGDEALVDALTSKGKKQDLVDRLNADDERDERE
jgi:hypothetical protein